MTGPDRVALELVVPGPEYPEVRNRSGVVIVWIAAVLVVVASVLSVAAASRWPAERSSPSSPAEPAGGAGRVVQPAIGTSPGTSRIKPQPDALEASRSGSGAERRNPADGVPPTIDRYRGTATWYCLSGSSACTSGYGPSDLVAAIDTDLGFSKGDRLVVRYRDRSVTVTVVDVCGCPGERLIDLTSGAFARLAPLEAGVIPVTLELAEAGSTLPPTEIAP